MTEREALKLALEVLEDTEYSHDRYEAIIAIKEALAQPEHGWTSERIAGIARLKEAQDKKLAQPEQEQLMSDQINYGMSVTQGGKRIDPMSIYKEPEQEPVTWRYKIVDVFGRPAWTLKTPKSDTRVLESQPLYITPPQRKPLTDEGKDRLANAWFSKDGDTDVAHRKAIALIEEVEAAHGIKGEV